MEAHCFDQLQLENQITHADAEGLLEQGGEPLDGKLVKHSA